MIEFFAKHPTAGNLLMLLMLVAGAFALPTMRMETFPEFRPDEVEVRVVYPGASAEEVENAICERVESAIYAVNHVVEVRSEAREGVAVVVAEMQDGHDIKAFLNDVTAQVDAIDDFPDEVDAPVIRELGTREPVISIAVTGDMSEPDLRWYCVGLRDRMRREDAIAQVEIEGFSQRQIRVEVPARELMKYGLGATDIAAAIRQQNVDLPSGTLEAQDQEVLVRFADERRSLDALKELVVVSAETGADVRLGDIAELTETFELAEERILFDGRRAGVLQITKSRTDDALTIYDAVRAFVGREQAIAPPGVVLALTQDVSSLVRDRLALLVKNGWQGLLLVFLIMWLFFNFRLSFWVAMGLPVSFMGAFFFLALFGYTLNMITTVALLVTLGLLMDDAIVIAENVAKHLTLGKTAIRATVDGVAEVRSGVVSSFLTTAVVFGPISFLAGAIGNVLKVLPVALLMVLLVSLVEAFLILPNHLAHSLHGQEDVTRGGVRRRLDSLVDWLRNSLLGKVVDMAVRRRYLVCGMAAGAFLLAVAMLVGGILKFQPFPEIDGNVVEARILLPQGSPLQRTEVIVDRVVAALRAADSEFAAKQDDGGSILRHVQVRYNRNADAHEAGPHIATVIVDLLRAEQREGRLDDFFDVWLRKLGPVPDTIHIGLAEPTFGPAGRPFEIRLQGGDLDDLKAASAKVVNGLNGYQGVTSVTDDLRPGKPEMRIKLRPGATNLGLSAQDIAAQLRTSIGGSTADEFQIGTESFEVDVRLARDDRNGLSDLDTFHVRGPNGTQVPLKHIAVVEPARGWARIARVDGVRTVTVQGDVNPGVANAGEITGEIREKLVPRLRHEHPGIEVSFEGQAKETGLTRPSLRRGFLLGLVGVFVILSFQFRGYVQPLVVMSAIPCAFVGVVFGHLLMGLSLSMPSAMGFASLAGVVVNDSILLVEFVRKQVGKGKAVAVAAAAASRERMRAVMLTSLTTIVGLLPLLTESSLQAQVLIPLATSIVFGLAASTLLVLIVLPAAITLLGDLGVVWASPGGPDHDRADGAAKI
jgi:hydrophobic/amphiphilic exporter-1 (mainly G- bacteria), HAE1 family